MNKLCKKCNTTKPITSFGVDKSASSGIRFRCKECDSKASIEYRTFNTEKANKSSSSWKSRNRDAVNEQRRKWLEANPDYVRNWNLENSEKNKKYYLDYYYRNPINARANEAARRVSKSNAMPAWVDKEKIKEVYAFAYEFREAGFDVHVDHIIPLRGKIVCGLHIDSNLRVIMAQENMQKGNKFLMLEEARKK